MQRRRKYIRLNIQGVAEKMNRLEITVKTWFWEGEKNCTCSVLIPGYENGIKKFAVLIVFPKKIPKFQLQENVYVFLESFVPDFSLKMFNFQFIIYIYSFFISLESSYNHHFISVTACRLCAVVSSPKRMPVNSNYYMLVTMGRTYFLIFK